MFWVFWADVGTIWLHFDTILKAFWSSKNMHHGAKNSDVVQGFLANTISGLLEHFKAIFGKVKVQCRDHFGLFWDQLAKQNGAFFSPVGETKWGFFLPSTLDPKQNIHCHTSDPKQNVFWFVSLCVIFPFRNWWLCRHEFVTQLLKILGFTMVFVQWVISACDVTCSNICVYWVLLWITIFLQFYFNFTLNLIKNPSKNGWSTRKHGLVTSKRPARLSFERFGPMLRQSCDHFGSFWNDLGSFWTFKNILNTFKTSGIA